MQKPKERESLFLSSLQFLSLIVMILCAIGLSSSTSVFTTYNTIHHNGTICLIVSRSMLWLFGILAYPITAFGLLFLSHQIISYKEMKHTTKNVLKITVAFAILSFSLSLIFTLLTKRYPYIGYLLKDWVLNKDIKIENVFTYYQSIQCVGGILSHNILFNSVIPIYSIIGSPALYMAFLSLSLKSASYLLKKLNPVKKNLLNAKLTPQERIAIKASSAPKFLQQSIRRENTYIMNSFNNENLLADNECFQNKINETIEEVSLSDSEYIKSSKNVIVETLSSFSINVTIGNVHSGPAFSLFEIHLPPGIKVQKVKQLADNISLRLRTESVRIITPVKGSDALGIEIPNMKIAPVGFMQILNDFIVEKSKCEVYEKLPLILGKDVYNSIVTLDLSSAPHMLIAGTTGSGKSVCINTILSSIIQLNDIDEVRLILIDPKMVELTQYNSCPHTMSDIITETKEAYYALKWLNDEMERRYETLKNSESRNIESYNIKNTQDKMFRIVCVIDEFNDLLMDSGSLDIEGKIVRLAQKSRAVGIHMIIATQRPSREVVTGLIKANFPTRIAFKVANRFDSQIILDESGAESLLGNGDMFISGSGPMLIRLQGSYISEEEVEQCNIDARENCSPCEKICSSFSELYPEYAECENLESSLDDPLIYRAIEIARDNGQISATLLQRTLKIGYPRAAGIIDHLTKSKIISTPNSQRTREFIGHQDIV